MMVSGAVGRLVAVVGLAVLTLGVLSCGDSTPHAAAGGAAGQSPTPTGGAGVIAVGGSATMVSGDDGIDCTLDECDDQGCTHIPRHFKCASNQLCLAGSGCVGPKPCLIDFECKTSDPCISYFVCTFALEGNFCSYNVSDPDGDGAYSLACGGNDCHEGDATQVGPSLEVCDGKDNDCDGEIDPPDASGCEAPLICSAGKCGCPGMCANMNDCVDLSSDEQHCGTCDTTCVLDETCSSGKCLCPAGQTRCGSSCVDTQTDANNCGTCAVNCGNAECAKGACSCTAVQTDCDAGAALDCRTTASDPTNCGSCGKQCLPASACGAGVCDAEVELVKLYGGADTVPYSSQLALDPSGNVYVALAATGEHRVLPAGVSSLWTADTALVKLDANADFVWAVDVNAAILAVQTSGSDVWLALGSNADIQVGQASFALAEQHAGFGLLVKLSGADGAVLDSHRFDFEQPPGSADMLIDSSGVWAYFTDGRAVDYLGATSTPPSDTYYSALFRVGTAMPRWLPGYAVSLAFDDNGKIVVGDEAPGFGASFSFGGDTLTTGKGDRSAAVRYSKDLAHEASFLLPLGETVGSQAFPVGDDVLFVGGVDGALQTYDFTGKLVATRGRLPNVSFAGGLRRSGEKISGYGSPFDKDQQFEGRSFAKLASYFMMLDASSNTDAVIDKAFTITVPPLLSANVGIAGFVSDPINSTLVLSVFYYNPFQIGDKTYGQAGKHGMAFVKLKLRQP